ncbi:MAG: glycosyltransferase family 2 protein [Cetobacterium sp.]|uniref:glycosyltransferase family 2 protein n=1 Tax=Cetobacterium sp. TaxID=2071632 RepID=UPI003F3026D1
MISIITPSYNSKEYILETIKSVQNQSYKNWEMIIIDDCSRDGTLELLEILEKEDSRIKILKNTENKGPGFCRNLGFKVASGEYICLLDSDDLWEEEKLEKQLQFMMEKNCSLSHSAYGFIDESGNKIKDVDISEVLDYKKLLLGNEIKTMGVMMKREITERFSMEDIKHEDYGFFLNILKSGIISHGFKERLCYCRIRRNSLSKNKLKSALWTWKIYRSHERLSIIKSLYYFINYFWRGVVKYR